MDCSRTWRSAPHFRRRATASGTARTWPRSGPSRAAAFSSPAQHRSAASSACCRPAPCTCSCTAAADGCTGMLKIERPKSDDGLVALASRYTLKGDPHSSHSIILEWLGEGRGRRLLDVGAADGLLSRFLTARAWKVTGIEASRVAAAAGGAPPADLIGAGVGAGPPPLA